MDKNLFLLKRNEHILLQNIDIWKGRVFERPFEFATTRNKVDVIIVSTQPNVVCKALGKDVSQEEITKITAEGEEEMKIVEAELEEEERKIREAIDQERERREREESPEKWPRLPNYEDQEGREPHYGDWEDEFDDFPYDDNDELEDLIMEGEEKRERAKELLADLERMENGRQIRRWYRGGVGEINQKLESLYPQQIISDFENIYSDQFSNYYLRLLDDRIGHIRKYRSRLNAGNLLGQFTRYWDKKGKETSRNIRLFLDNIDSEASRLTVGREELVAQVYIHELFHAYYSDILTERYALVDCINEIEEAMAECGMLLVMEQLVTTQMVTPTFLNTAQRCVLEKWQNPSPRLKCYGLGYHLYDLWRNPGRQYYRNRGYNQYIFKGELLSLYQKIQLSVRNSRKKISSLKHTLSNNNPSEKKCIALLCELFYLHDYIKRDKSQHHYFNNQTFGCNNRMVYAILDHYIQRNNPSYNDITRDFSNSFNQNPPGFQDENQLTRAEGRNFDFNQRSTLSDGTVIVPRIVWKGGRDGEIVVFIKEVDKLYKQGKLDKHVLYLG